MIHSIQCFRDVTSAHNQFNRANPAIKDVVQQEVVWLTQPKAIARFGEMRLGLCIA